MTSREFREADCEVWRQRGTSPGWRAKHKPSGIVITSGHSWQEEKPGGMLDGLKRVVERHWSEEDARNTRHDELSAKIATENGWTVHCRGGCDACNWQGFLLPDGTPIQRKEYEPKKTRRHTRLAKADVGVKRDDDR